MLLSPPHLLAHSSVKYPLLLFFNTSFSQYMSIESQQNKCRVSQPKRIIRVCFTHFRRLYNIIVYSIYSSLPRPGSEHGRGTALQRSHPLSRPLDRPLGKVRCEYNEKVCKYFTHLDTFKYTFVKI